MNMSLGQNPQPREAFDAYPEYGCDEEDRGCRFRSDDERDFALCEHPGCPKESLCDSCLFECQECERLFCREHIEEISPSEYLCHACFAKRSRAA